MQDMLKHFCLDIRLKYFETAFLKISKLMQILFSLSLKTRLDDKGNFSLPVEATT